MKNCPTCGHAMSGKQPTGLAIEIEGDEAHEPDGDMETSAKDEILSELMEALQGSLSERLKSKPA